MSTKMKFGENKWVRFLPIEHKSKILGFATEFSEGTEVRSQKHY